MGVRGKIEAVLYAAEEPVTLAQLAALFGDEALVEQQAALTPEQMTLPAPDAEAAEPAQVTARADAADAVQGAPEELQEQNAEDRHAAAQVRQQDRARRDIVRTVLQELVAAYGNDDRGMEIREIAGGFRVATKPEYHDAVRSFARSLKPPMKLSLQALETLAVIAYKQPVTAPEVSEVRGVDSGGVLGSLMSRKLVTTAGRKQVLGRPILYKTTREFLLRFGLKDLNELPSMEEFEKMAGELQALNDEPELTHAAGEPEEPALERPDAPELSVIVEEVQPAALPGVQVNEDGSVAADEEVAAEEKTGSDHRNG